MEKRKYTFKKGVNGVFKYPIKHASQKKAEYRDKLRLRAKNEEMWGHEKAQEIINKSTLSDKARKKLKIVERNVKVDKGDIVSIAEVGNIKSRQAMSSMAKNAYSKSISLEMGYPPGVKNGYLAHVAINQVSKERSGTTAKVYYEVAPDEELSYMEYSQALTRLTRRRLDDAGVVCGTFTPHWGRHKCVSLGLVNNFCHCTPGKEWESAFHDVLITILKEDDFDSIPKTYSHFIWIE